MPSSPNNVQFSLPNRYIEQLANLAQQKESTGKCAKRLLIELLETKSVPTDKLQAIESRLEALEQRLTPVNDCVQNQSPVEGLTTAELAKIFDVHRSQISRWKQKGDLRLLDWEYREGKWYKRSD